MHTWRETGLLERELVLYRRFAEKGLCVDFITYGGKADRSIPLGVDGARVHCNGFHLPSTIYPRLMGWLHRRALSQASVIKSNQVLGAEQALAVARRLGKPFVARCGYLHSDFMERANGADSQQARTARAMERQVFSQADRTIVTTAAMEGRLVEEYGVPADRITVIPNYVDTDLFRPAPRPGARRLCFVGRLAEQKNLPELFEALEGTDIRLTLAGDGHLRQDLEAMAQTRGIEAEFLGPVPHADLPSLFDRCDAFVLPSLYEGHPKSLIEAMAAGLPVIGTRVSGIRELIGDRDTGLLCQPEAASLKASILELLADQALADRLGTAARAFTLREFSLDRVAEREYALIRGLVA